MPRTYLQRGKIYLCSEWAGWRQEESILFIMDKSSTDKNLICVLLASTINYNAIGVQLGSVGLKKYNIYPSMDFPTRHIFYKSWLKDFKKVPFQDLPLYIGMRYITENFSKILKQSGSCPRTGYLA